VNDFPQLWEVIHPHRKGKLHRDRSPPTTARRSWQPSHKKLIRQDATDPKQKAVTDYKEQVDRHTPTPNPYTRKLISRRTNTTTTDITTTSPISEQRPQEIAHVTYLTLT